MIVYVNRKKGLTYNEDDFEGYCEREADKAMYRLPEEFLEFIDRNYTPRQAYIEGGNDGVFAAYVNHLKENLPGWERVEI
jgi:hypothetical protein